MGHGYNQIHKINCKVNIFDMEVNPNDLIHADLHGAVVIKRENLEKLPNAISKLLKKENFIFDYLNKNKKISIKKFKEKYRKFMGKK